MLSKTLAEEASWKFAKENGMDMVVMNPGWVIGPVLHPILNLSVEEVPKLINGTLQQLIIEYLLCSIFLLEYHYMLHLNTESTSSYSPSKWIE